MEYKKIDNKIIIRLDIGEEIISSLTCALNKENILSGSITGIGATNKFAIGAYNVEKKEYKKNEFVGEYEIVSLIGNITNMDNKPYLHIHMSAGDKKGNVVGGHLNEAYISATCEIVIEIINADIGRFKDDKTGLNLFVL